MKNFLNTWGKRAIWFALAVVVVISVVLYSRARAGTDGNDHYQTVRLERGNLTATVGATGTVRARQSAILTWQTSGTVEQVNVEVGDRVQKDQVLATLEKTSLSQNIILAEADLANAQRRLEDLLASDTPAAQAWIALRNAQDAYDKAKDYYDSLFEPQEYTLVVYSTIVTPTGVRRIPRLKTVKTDKADDETIADAEADLALKKAQLEDAQRNYERLKDGPDAVELATVQAQIAAAQATLNLARITAPFAGTITEAHPLPGDIVSPGMVAFRLDDLSELLVDVEVSEVDINRVQIGQDVTLTFDAILDKEYHGVVTEVAQVGNEVQGVVNFTVTVKLTDADEQVKPGMTAAVNIVVEELEDVLLVPNRAVRMVEGKRVVYLLQDGELVAAEIRLGASSDTMSVVVGGDVREGDEIVLNPPTQMPQGHPPFIQR